MYEYRVKKVVRVVDGDTVDVIIDLGFDISKMERVRVGGVDTPEKRTRDAREKMLGNDATQFAEEWFAVEGDLIVRTEKEGKYGRMIGFFYKNGECFNDRVVDEGYGFAYYGGTKRDMEQPESVMLLLNKRGYDSWEDYAEANQ